MNFDQLYQEFLDQDDSDIPTSHRLKMKWFFDQAHRQGWEQAKAEARVLSFSCSCGKAITGMEYKGA